MILTGAELALIDRQVFDIYPTQPNEDNWCKKRKANIAALRARTRELLIQKAIKEKSNMEKEFYGVTVNLAHPDIAGAKTPSDIEKLELFSHLEEPDRSQANVEVFEASRTSAAAPATPATEESKD